MTKLSFISECTKIIAQMENKEIVTKKGDFYKKSTITNISKVFFYNLPKYQQKLGKEILCENINYQFFEDFRLYLLKENYAKNSISSIISVVKSFTKKLYRKGITTFDGADVSTPYERTTAIYTTIEELSVLYHLDLSKTPGQERVRDVYVCQCFLGLRIKDMFNFMANFMKMARKIDGKYYFKIRTQKTNETVVIPCSIMITKIAERRKFNFGKPFSEQYYRRELKQIYKKANLDKSILYNRTEGGELQEKKIMRSSILGTHTARRSFATNTYLAGINPLDIMKITGHKSFFTFMNYIRCENLEVALKLSEHEFFNTAL